MLALDRQVDATPPSRSGADAVAKRPVEVEPSLPRCCSLGRETLGYPRAPGDGTISALLKEADEAMVVDSMRSDVPHPVSMALTRSSDQT